MTEPAKKPLRCNKCRTLATGDLAVVAKPGGTHYIVHRREGVVGMRGATRAVSCGTWTEQQETPA